MAVGLTLAIHMVEDIIAVDIIGVVVILEAIIIVEILINDVTPVLDFVVVMLLLAELVCILITVVAVRTVKKSLLAIEQSVNMCHVIAGEMVDTVVGNVMSVIEFQ